MIKLKNYISIAALAATTLASQAAIISTEEMNTNDFTDIGGTTSNTFSETFAGAWGTFDLEITMTASASVVLNVNSPEHENNNFSFSIAITNDTLNADYSLQNLTFTSIKFNAANGSTDAGEFVGPWGTQAWLDGNADQGIAGHDIATTRFDLNTLNGGVAFTAYSSNNTGSVYRINDVKATVDVDFVPEPSSTALLGLGSLALMTRRRR